MREKLENLLKLQEIELAIGRLNAFLRTVTEKMEALDAKQAVLEGDYNKEAAAMGALKKKYRDMESDVQTNTIQIKKSHDKLNAVKNNKEYQATLKEIDDYKDRNYAIEDEMIVCLEQMEGFETELSEKKEVLERSKVQISAEKEAIWKEAEDDTKRLSEAEALQQRLLGQVDAALLADYLRIRRIVKGPAVVCVQQSVCKGCHLNIPPQMFIELQRGDKLKFCPHCDRILFWDEILGI
jgi:uncharacterized protein